MKDKTLFPDNSQEIIFVWALFCSSKCPAEIILKTHELAQQFQKNHRGLLLLNNLYYCTNFQLLLQ